MSGIDKLDVRFTATESINDNCLCNCCHGTGKVLKLHIPSTLYHDGKHLSTKYSEMWVCQTCIEKLINALRGQTESEAALK